MGRNADGFFNFTPAGPDPVVMRLSVPVRESQSEGLLLARELYGNNFTEYLLEGLLFTLGKDKRYQQYVSKLTPEQREAIVARQRVQGVGRGRRAGARDVEGEDGVRTEFS